MVNSGSDSHDQKEDKDQKENKDQKDNAVDNGNDLNKCCNRKHFNCKCFLKVLLLIIIILRFVLFVMLILANKTTCHYEKTSILNCTQEIWGSKSNLQDWMVVWFVLSMVSSIFFIYLWFNLKYIMQQCKSVIQNSSCCKIHLRKWRFLSFFVLFVITFVYDMNRIISDPFKEIGIDISVLLLLWSPVNLTVVYFLNYLNPVKWPTKNDKNVNTVLTYLLYWFSLFIYLIETGCVVLSVTADAVLSFAPIITKKPKDEDIHLNGFVIIALTIRSVYYACLFTFFWSKIFHGTKDLLSEPNINLSEWDKAFLKDHENADQEMELKSSVGENVQSSSKNVQQA